MSDLEHGGAALGRIHARRNDAKFFAHFTDFLEGIIASGYVETGEVEPLLAECHAFIIEVSDGDARDVVEDFEADCFEAKAIQDAVDVRMQHIDPLCEKSCLNRFLGFCRGVVCDGVITIEEANGILRLIDRSPDLLKTVGVKQIQISCLDAVEDGILSADESADICDAIGYVVGDCYGDTGLAQTSGVANFQEHRLEDLALEFDGATIVLTGNFQTSPRRLLEHQLASLGVRVGRSVSRKTDFILIGGEAARDWIELNRGTKIRKAQELRLESERPKFISELQLLRHLKG